MTSYTSSVSLEDECHQTIHDAIVKLCLELRPMDGPSAVIRTDPAPSFKALVDDPLLKKHRITIELGRAKLGSVATSALNSLSVHVAYPCEKCGHSGTSFQNSR